MISGSPLTIFKKIVAQRELEAEIRFLERVIPVVDVHSRKGEAAASVNADTEAGAYARMLLDVHDRMLLLDEPELGRKPRKALLRTLIACVLSFGAACVAALIRDAIRKRVAAAGNPA